GAVRHELLGDLRVAQRLREVAAEAAKDRELQEPVVLERAVAARPDDRRAGGLVVLVAAERVAMPPVAPEPVDQPQARRDELRVGRVTDPLQELESPVAVLAQLIERRAAELQMREAARHAIARVQVVAALQAVLDALPVQMDA